MENSIQQPYCDSPTSSRSPSPTRHILSPTALPDSSIITKPLPALPQDAPSYSPTQDEPYRDEPPTPSDTRRSSGNHHIEQAPHYNQPYTDIPPLTPNNDDDNIPLAHLFLNPYPHEAPPSYAVAVLQSHSNRDTLIQYIPNNEHTSTQYISRHGRTSSIRPVVIEIDEESGEVVSRTDDVRHSVEKVVAMFVVAALLLVLSAVLAWFAIGSGAFER